MNFRAYDVKYLPSGEFDVGEKMVLMVLLSMRNLDEIYISHKALSRQSSLSVPTLKRKLEKLKIKNVVVTKVRGAGKTLNYEVDILNLLKFTAKSNPDLFKKMEKHFDVTLNKLISLGLNDK
jgi:hypothetical protein